MEAAYKTDFHSLVGRVNFWTDDEYKATWKPERERIGGYRNYLVHEGRPFVVVPVVEGVCGTPRVLHPDHFVPDSDKAVRWRNLTWQQQRDALLAPPEKLTGLPEAAELVYARSADWLNRAYGRMIDATAHLPDNPAYRRLWGWDAHGPRIVAGQAVGVTEVTGSGIADHKWR